MAEDSVRISINKIKADMVLARDVVTSEGQVLLAGNTMLNNINYSKLKAHEIKYVYVKTTTIDESRPDIKYEIHTIERQRVPVEEQEGFKEFAKTYEEKNDEIKKQLLAISDGQVIEIGELYGVTNDVMGKLKSKGDIFTFMGVIKTVSEHTYTHSNNVALLCNLFGHWLGLSGEEMVNLTASGMLHDIGKTKTPPEILNKKGKLTESEFEEMKKHTLHGYRILQTQDIRDEIKLSALMHHEKIDGSGYPLGAKNAQINKTAKIVAICDIYDAMTANRVYRDKICPFKVIHSFETNCYGELDTALLLVFLQNIAYNYIGIWVKLSDGREAEVVFINPTSLSRPIVRTVDGDMIDLASDRSLTIESLI